MVTRTTSPESVTIPAIDIRNITLTLIGDAPLIVHKWSEKAKRQMLEKQTKAARTAKEAKNPEQDYMDSLYVMEDGRYGFPAIGIKAAAVSACRFVEGMRMTEARGAFHINAELLPVNGTPTMREDMVRVGMGVADLRYRGEFKLPWSIEVPIAYNAKFITVAQIVNLFNNAGFGVGIGEWRPDRDGQMGRFHVASSEEMNA